jgi:hypothetical protein
MRIVTLAILIFFVSVGCLERFEPQGTKLINLLVVEGQLSTGAEGNTIKLSRTRAIGMKNMIPEQNAIVKVTDGHLNDYFFKETLPGTYYNPAADLTAKVGEKYVLDIVTAGGSHYQSNPVTLKQTPPIEKVYYRSETRLADDGRVLSGIAVYLDAFDENNATNYYRWEWIENWEIKMPVNSKFDFQVDKDTVGMGYPIPKILPVDVCYSSDTSSKIMLASTKTLSKDRVKKYEINFINTRGFKLKSLYGIIVKQYALDEAGYKYWEALRVSSEGVGTLFDPQPYELTGNVFNTDDSKEPVLGYFGASTVSVNSLVVIRDQLDSLIYPLEQCLLEKDTVPYRLVKDYLQSGYLIDTTGQFGSTYVIMAPVDCADCRLYGSLERPKFRPD